MARIPDNPGNIFNICVECQPQMLKIGSISLKRQLQKNLQEQEMKLEDFLLRKTFTDSMKN